MKLNFIPGTNYEIYSIENSFSFGIDAILLSDFSKIPKNAIGLEIGGGTGIVSLRMDYIYNPKLIYCVEIQKENYLALQKNINFNKLNDKIIPVNKDINKCYEDYDNDKFDFIVTNPPYYRYNSGITNKNKNQYISRYEVYLKLEDIFKFSKYKLKTKGVLYMINRANRIVDIFEYARKYNLEPKEMIPVLSRSCESPKMVLVKFVKNAGKNFEYKKPLIIYDENGEYTKNIKEIYYGE